MGRIIGELALWLGLAAAAFALSFEFADEAGTYAWGAASWPRMIIVLMTLVALAQFAIRRRALGTRAALEPGTAPDILPRSPEARVKLVGALGLPLVYVYLLPHAGFYATTPFFLAAYLAVLGERRPAVLILAPLVIYAVVNLVFTKLFYVALPTGNWPGFYEFSNWFLVTLR